jgi:hypothetical protein
MEHMRAICKGIGPRPSTSKQEQQAVDNLDNIEPETLSHAAEYTWGLVQALDQKA